MARFGRVGMVARWKPVHLGHAAVLRALCENADAVVIGVGSSNRHSLRSPFSYEETAEMITVVLAGRKNFFLLPVPDLDDGPRWRLMVRELFGELDLFLTDNPYVAGLMKGLYEVARPVEIVLPEERVAVDGTQVRLEMARGGEWERLVPPEVAAVIREKKLDERFRKEFGLEALASSLAVGAG